MSKNNINKLLQLPWRSLLHKNGNDYNFYYKDDINCDYASGVEIDVLFNIINLYYVNFIGEYEYLNKLYNYQNGICDPLILQQEVDKFLLRMKNLNSFY